MIDITPVINAVIAIIAAVITAFLVPWIKSKTTEQQRKETVHG
jgi:quinol-cytochrome oxidoreductase complex cytochrome b subunit